jgi:putative ABC transport system permease protein
MFSLIESFRSALQSIRAHSFRSFLTTLGIIIGVASVITVISIVQGLSHSIKGEFEGLGANSLTIRSYTPFEDAMQGKRNHLSINDYEKIVENIDDITNVSPSFSPFAGFGTQARYGSQAAFSQISAVKSVYQKTNQMYPKYGRFISDSDERSRRKVTVIGNKLRENLKLPENPVGTFIEIGGEWFKIIGLNESQGETFGFSKDDYALIPFSVGQAIAGNSSKLDIVITFNVVDMEQLIPVQDRLTSLLRQIHQLKPGQKNDFRVQTSEQLMETFSKVIDMLTLVLGGIVSISLLVGGIGIMNIMLVSVTERTREIGICKALGAQRHHILLQFLIEAMTLSLLGGIIGLGLGFFLGFIAAKMIPGFPDAYVPFWAIALSLGFSTAVGMVFGIMPAAKAANLDPIDALRYE